MPVGRRSLVVGRLLTLGAIALGISESPRLYCAADLALAEELARRAALAVDNARLYHEAEAARREIEGLMGAGTSTTAAFLTAHRERSGIAALFMLEGPTIDDPHHPLRVATDLSHPTAAWRDVTVEP